VWNLSEARSVDWRGEKREINNCHNHMGINLHDAGMNQIGLWQKLSVTNTISKTTNNTGNTWKGFGKNRSTDFPVTKDMG